ncbi:hypothetical protein FRB94_002973 [Tulasnella sp. JGI-2019a]|nr:hypothetical protein FRB93_010146 [Tulasnella sp. JGI-2019a]KAG8986282.1 hypothetical protein FRB94_002973 [Tulasnella sp. JGI-2019a]
MDLLATIFPWVEAEEAALKACAAAEPLSKDMALSKFLGLMKWLQMVIIQDAAILQHELPDSALWGHMPFNTVQFCDFSWVSVAQVDKAEQEACMALKEFPPSVVQTVQGLVQVLVHAGKAKDAVITKLTQSVGDVQAHLKLLAMGGHTRGKRLKS